jgi:hypothetical protein
MRVCERAHPTTTRIVMTAISLRVVFTNNLTSTARSARRESQPLSLTTVVTAVVTTVQAPMRCALIEGSSFDAYY